MACSCRGARASSPGRVAAAAKAVASTAPERLRLQLHSAELLRSFTSVGVMDPYVVVLVDGQEVHRTAPARRGHRAPRWDAACQVKAEGVPGSITIAVWTANRLHKDVLCGSVTLPCSVGMIQVENKEFTLTKRAQPTGTIRLSLALLAVQPPAARSESARNVMSAPGEELDQKAQRPPTLLAGVPLSPSKVSRGPSQEFLQQALPRGPSGLAEQPEAQRGPSSPDRRSREKEEKEAEQMKVVAAPAETCEDAIARVLVGSWTCVATHGLDEFLKHTGTGPLQRRLAMAARWPSWDFNVEGHSLHFLNHSAMGDLKEEIRLDGCNYQSRDGRGNLSSCSAKWQKTADGGILTISRTGTLGTYSEERKVAGDTLTFALTNADGASWGRTFQRAS